MRGRRAALGAALLCALCIAGLAAASAPAATLYACEKVAEGTGKWEDSSCKGAKEKGSFERVASPVNTATAVNGTRATEATFAMFTPVHQDIVCQQLTSTGTTTNVLVSETMQNTGEKVTFKFSECGFKKEGTCKIKGGEFEFANLKSSTFLTGSGQTRVKFSAASEEKLGTIPIEGCIGTPMPVQGSIIGIPDGITLNFTTESSSEGKMYGYGYPLTLVMRMFLSTTGGKSAMFE